MAKKKQEIALQKEILDDEAWEKELGHNGIMVIDVYQNWAGPCKAVVALFRRLKNELADELLGYAVAQADTVTPLSFYRGKCTPTFVIYADRKLQAVVRGCNAPLLERTINQQLAREHKVQSGEIERSEFVDPELEALVMAEEAARLEALKPKPIPKTCTVCVIKPDAVEAGHTEEILEKMRECGMEIWKTEEKTLTEEEARMLYKDLEEEDYFESLMELMTMGPCLVVLVTKGATGEEVIPEMRKLVGPTDAEHAKEEDPECLRALYGTSKLSNALHAADSKDQAAHELAFFFPDIDLPMQETVEPGQLQRTLAIIRPDAYRERGSELLAQIEASGFTVALQKEITLTREQAMDFYQEHKDEEFFEMLIDNMTSGPVLALGLAREEAVSRWRDMLGPKEKAKAVEEAPQSLRAQFDVEQAAVNQIHGSDSAEAAEKEINFFFPRQETLAVIKPNAIHKREEIIAKIESAGFEVSQQKQSHLTKEMAESFYGEHHEQDFFPELVDFMISGESQFLVLTREDAVDGFRELCGNKDPALAQSEHPDSIRAMFGDDILRNAVHSSSTQEQAFQKIGVIFAGEMEKASRAGSAAGGDVSAEQEPETAQPEAATAEDGEKDTTEGGEGEQSEEKGKAEDTATAEGGADDEGGKSGDVKPDASGDSAPEGDQGSPEQEVQETAAPESAQTGASDDDKQAADAESKPDEAAAPEETKPEDATEAPADAPVTSGEDPAAETPGDEKKPEEATGESSGEMPAEQIQIEQTAS